MTRYDTLRKLGRLLRVLIEWDIEVARLIWAGTGAMTEKRFDDPVYKKNVQRLIERNRRFEEPKG